MGQFSDGIELAMHKPGSTNLGLFYCNGKKHWNLTLLESFEVILFVNQRRYAHFIFEKLVEIG
ncbi:hypothetical protein SAMN05444412_101342 [Rhodonellum ikkaensis]|uniref:Uncharacterized protein n=1 Tax=Rhodonellum ikkaensis TaxID=336829 RepID=A0A1H3KEL9_9BACT|nr:hypothetical protein SAMN05444412_101342 [Rhodonellum ikkaensis]